MHWIFAACALSSMDFGDSAEAGPNIVIILADDMGYGDPHCNNPDRGRIPTPHIDRLASQGMRFTDAHSSSGVCSPSRYALLTGRYHWRTRLQSGIVGLWGQPLIAPDRLTIAGLARGRGYRTAAIGKWHLGREWPIGEGKQALFRDFPKGSAAGPGHRAAWAETFAKPVPGGPTTRGFDTYFGTDVPNWPPYCFIEDATDFSNICCKIFSPSTSKIPQVCGVAVRNANIVIKHEDGRLLWRIIKSAMSTSE